MYGFLTIYFIYLGAFRPIMYFQHKSDQTFYKNKKKNKLLGRRINLNEIFVYNVFNKP